MKTNTKDGIKFHPDSVEISKDGLYIIIYRDGDLEMDGCVPYKDIIPLIKLAEEYFNE